MRHLLDKHIPVIIIIMKAKIIVTLYIKNVARALYTVNYNENTLSVSVSVNAAWNSVVNVLDTYFREFWENIARGYAIFGNAPLAAKGRRVRPPYWSAGVDTEVFGLPH